ncbi:MAG: esterase-like activity of phytase family protein [Sphingosinicella sp.]|uniref:esterase-like activity of phytase family protein n=1 Tax=Sphingosinicella sp. TaxID=1917971 RepID=UPI0040378751
MKERSFLNRLSWSGFGLFCFLLLATPVRPGPPAPKQGPAIARLHVAPVPLDRANPAGDRVGDLVFLGGWALASDDPRFGGISAMHIGGGIVTAVSDAGTVLRFPLPAGAGESRVDIAPVPRGPGSGRRKSDRDVEAMFIDGNRVWLAFESRNQVWRYALPGWRAEAAAAPRAMRRWRRMLGAEAMTRLSDGRFLLISEASGRVAGESDALLFAGDPAVAATPSVALRYRPPAGYRATDAARLPDGRLLVLNRRFDWLEGVSTALVLVEPDAIRPGATFEGRLIARLGWPLAGDNMEALSVTSEGGRTILWLASDDNFSPLQRTLLLKFALGE